MTGDDFLNFNEEEDFIEQISKCEDAYTKGEIELLNFSEEEFDYLIGYFIEEGDDTLVYDLTRTAYTRHPYSSDLVVRYADVLIVNREVQKAIEILNNQMGFDSSNSDIYFLLGRGYLRQGDHPTAKENIKKAITLSSDEAGEMLTTVAQEYIDINEFAMALEYLKEAEKLEENNTEIFNDIAFCLERIEQFKESLVYYEKYLDADPFNENVWFNVGTIYARVENFAKSLEAFDYALALDPKNSSVLYNKAIVYVNTEQYHMAIETFKEFLKYEPGNFFALIGIADAYLAYDQIEDAAIAFQVALVLDLDNLEANSGLAYISMLKEDHYGALIYLRRIISNEKMDYQFMDSQIFLTYKRTELPEFLVYHLVALYHMRSIDSFITNLETLLTLDELWLNKLYELIPKLKKDIVVSKKIKKLKEK
ncbi:MAG: tetratricopeptide repeat protein [Rikenellaceae bacterium]